MRLGNVAPHTCHTSVPDVKTLIIPFTQFCSQAKAQGRGSVGGSTSGPCDCQLASFHEQHFPHARPNQFAVNVPTQQHRLNRDNCDSRSSCSDRIRWSCWIATASSAKHF